MHDDTKYAEFLDTIAAIDQLEYSADQMIDEADEDDDPDELGELRKIRKDIAELSDRALRLAEALLAPPGPELVVTDQARLPNAKLG